MLFTEAELGCRNPLSILDEAVYLTEQESNMSSLEVPLLEDKALGVWKIPYHTLCTLCQQHGVCLLDGIGIVSEANRIDSEHVVLAIDEADAISNPDLVSNGSIPFVVTPISDQDPIYKLCEDATELWLETENQACLQELADGLFEKLGDLGADAAHYLYMGTHPKLQRLLTHHQVEHDSLKTQLKNDRSKYGERRDDRFWKRNQLERKAFRQEDAQRRLWKVGDRGYHHDALVGTGYILGKYGSKAALIAGVGVGANKLIKAYRNKPKSVIAKKIASLRKIYSKWMQRAQSSKDSGIVSKLRRGAAKILQVIDKLLGLLQSKADNR